MYLLHPLMPHSATKNLRRDLRVITNPPVSLKSPFVFDRRDGEGEYSIGMFSSFFSIGCCLLSGIEIRTFLVSMTDSLV